MNSPNKGTPSWKTGKWPALLENIKQERWIHAESCLSWQHVIQFLTEELKLATVSNREMFYISVSSRKAAATEHCGSIQQASLHKVLENPDNENNGKNPRPGWKARLQPNLLLKAILALKSFLSNLCKCPEDSNEIFISLCMDLLFSGFFCLSKCHCWQNSKKRSFQNPQEDLREVLLNR